MRGCSRLSFSSAENSSTGPWVSMTPPTQSVANPFGRPCKGADKRASIPRGSPGMPSLRQCFLLPVARRSGAGGEVFSGIVAGFRGAMNGSRTVAGRGCSEPISAVRGTYDHITAGRTEQSGHYKIKKFLSPRMSAAPLICRLSKCGHHAGSCPSRSVTKSPMRAWK
jgi:hypothetical protein